MLKTLFGPGAAMYTLAAGATQPIFEGGTLLGQLDLQKGTREELLQDYRMAVISAFTDVEKALAAIQQTTLQEQLQRASVAESRRAYDLSLDKLRQGTIDQTTLLTVEQTPVHSGGHSGAGAICAAGGLREPLPGARRRLA